MPTAPNKLKILGLCGLAGSGKSFVARRAVQKFLAVPMAFAMPFKLRAVVLGGLNSPSEINQVFGREVKSPHVRHALQQMGTEQGRDTMGPNVWLDHWRLHAQWLERMGVEGVVVDDVRFPNEARAIREMGGEVWKIIGPKPIEEGVLAQHRSETEIDKITPNRLFVRPVDGDITYLDSIDRALSFLFNGF